MIGGEEKLILYYTQWGKWEKDKDKECMTSLIGEILKAEYIETET